MLQIRSVQKPTERQLKKSKQPLSRVYIFDFELVTLFSNGGADNVILRKHIIYIYIYIYIYSYLYIYFLVICIFRKTE